MTPAFDALLFGDIFDRLRLQLPDPIVNWLTPVWILSLGALAGLILCALLWAVFKALSLIPGVGTLADRPGRKWVAVGVLTAALYVLALILFPQVRGVRSADARQNAERAAANEQAENLDAADRAANAIDDRPPPTVNSLIDRAARLGGTLLVAALAALMIVTLVSHRALAETGIALREGVLWPLLITCIVMSVFSVLGLFVVRKPADLLASLARWPVLAAEGKFVETYEIPAPPDDTTEPPETPVEVSFRKSEIQELTATSNQRIRIRTEPFAKDSTVAVTIEVEPGKQATWNRASSGVNPFRDDVVNELYVKNYGASKATLTLAAQRRVAHPQMLLVPMMAISIAGVFFLYLLQRAALPKMAAVALSTAKSEIAQPLYSIIMAIGIFLLIVFVFIPYNTFGDDIKMLKDSGMSLILVLCIIQAVWAASSSVADEVEGKTALTVLSKPVSRRDFLIGKFVGIAWAVGLMAVIFSLLVLVTVAYKPVYDFREGGYESPDAQNTDPTWQNCYAEMVQVVPGLVLAYFEVLVMAALSVAISTRLPALANFIISFAVYVLGHLTPLLVQSQVVAEQLPPVVFFGRLIATVLPVLDHFNIQASVAAGVSVPITYLAWSLAYCALYSAVAMLLALTLFEDRDLA